MRSFFLTFFCFIVAVAAFADKPLKVVYKKTVTRNFAGKWSVHPKQTYTVVQRYLAPSAQAQKVSYATRDDVSNYRFHNSHLTYQNQWGYFFPAGTRPVINNGVVVFKSPNGYKIAPQK